MSGIKQRLEGAPLAIIDLMHGLATRDVDLIDTALAPDVEWVLVGRPDRFPLGGLKSKTVLLDMLRVSLPAFTSFRFDVEGWAQNGDRVFVEAVTAGVGPGTAAYNNRYLMRFVVRDGLIVRALEHHDPFEALVYIEQATA